MEEREAHVAGASTRIQTKDPLVRWLDTLVPASGGEAWNNARARAVIVVPPSLGQLFWGDHVNKLGAPAVTMRIPNNMI